MAAIFFLTSLCPLYSGTTTLRPEEAQWAKRCLLFLPFPFTLYFILQLCTTNPAGTRAAALFDDFTLTQTVMSPTRFSPDGQSSSVLDLFAIDRPDLVVSTEVGDPISDHCYVTSTLSLRSPLPPKQTVTRFDYAHADWHGLFAKL